MIGMCPKATTSSISASEISGGLNGIFLFSISFFVVSVIVPKPLFVSAMIFYRFIAIFSSYSYQIVIQTMKKRASFAAPSNMFFYQSHIPQTILSSIPREETPILSLSSPIFYTPSTMAIFPKQKSRKL